MRLSPRRLAVALSAVAGLLPATVGLAGSAAALGATRGIHPGVSISFGGVTCTAGPILRQRHAVFIAIPASCGGIDEGKVQDGCVEAETPIGSPVQIGGAHHRGLLVYNSFSHMQLHGVQSLTRCYYNDLALVKVDRRDVHLVSGRIPGQAAPNRVSRRSPSSGSSLRIGAMSGTAGATHHHGWELDVTITGTLSKAQVGTTATQGPRVVGMLTTIPQGVLPMGASGVYSFAKELKALRQVHGYHHVRLLAAGERA